MRFKVKNQITEKAQPSTIDAPFNLTDVESSAQMQVYNDVLPFGDRLLVLALIALALIVLLAWPTDSASDSPVGAHDLAGMVSISVGL